MYYTLRNNLVWYGEEEGLSFNQEGKTESIV